MRRPKTFHHNVYVILLDPAVLEHRSVLRLNPKRDPGKPCLYVGMTGLPVEHRFENHKHGYKSAWVVEKYGVRLLPELYAPQPDAVRGRGSDGNGTGGGPAGRRLHRDGREMTSRWRTPA